MAFSTYLAGRLLDWLSGTTAMPALPTALAVSFHSGNPGPAGTASDVTSLLNGTGARLIVPQAQLSATGLVSPFGFEKVNTQVLVVTTSSVSAAPVVVSHFTLWDDATAGNALYYNALLAPAVIEIGDLVKFDPATLSIRCL